MTRYCGISLIVAHFKILYFISKYHFIWYVFHYLRRYILQHKDTDELAAEKDRLAALECWDSTTPSSLTIGHVYMKVNLNRVFRVKLPGIRYVSGTFCGDPHP